MISRNKLSDLLDSNPNILRVLAGSASLSEARRNMFAYLNQCEEQLRSTSCELHSLEKKNASQCILVFKNIISEINEQKTNHSCLNTLWALANEAEQEKRTSLPEVSDAFLMEMKHLFKGVMGLSEIYSKSGICINEIPAFINMTGKAAAVARSETLNERYAQYDAFVQKNNYKTGIAKDVVDKRERNKQKILEFLGGTEQDWLDYRWQLKMCFKKAEDIQKIISLSDDEQACINKAIDHKLPFGITPFYLSLMECQQDVYQYDRSLRAQVIPNRVYLSKMLEIGLDEREQLDFMHEQDTSPVGLVTRRYPMIAILKPLNWCPQVCIYCQRNWELSGDQCSDKAISSKLDEAFAWFENNPGINEVLVTGGDPLAMNNTQIEYVLQRLTMMKHIKRIRLGTRILVNMPMRFDDELIEILKRYHQPPFKTITIMTHVQHSYEITPDLVKVVAALRRVGIDIYNQQVFTFHNCRRFETSFLRESLKGIGINPYYLFNLKGKDETGDFKVPIARLLQEQKEEARLLPGIVRTDRAVFNLPTLGKNDLSGWQDHDVVMILDDGSRVYEFYPWEKFLAPMNTFLYKDEPIYNFLNKLEGLGENPEDYKTIWYYF